MKKQNDKTENEETLCYSSIVDSLVERFKGAFSENMIKENGNLPHVFFEHYFVPYIKKYF